MKNTFTILFLLITTITFSQNLKLEDIMKGNEFIGIQPTNITMLPFNKGFTFNWKKHKNRNSDKYVYLFEKGKVQPLTILESMEYPDSYIENKNGDVVYFIKNGTIKKWNEKDELPTPLYQSTEGIFNLKLVKDDKLLAFQKGKNLFLFGLKFSFVRQITNFIDQDAPEERLNPMEEEQLAMFDYLDKKRDKKLKPINGEFEFPVKLYELNGKILSDLSVSSDLKHVFFKLTSKADVKYTKMPKYVTQDGYTVMQTARPKVGRPDAKQELVYFNTTTNNYKTISLNALSGIKKAPAYFKNYNREMDLKENKLTHIHAPIFSKDGKALIEVRSLDNKDRWICLFDEDKQELVELNHQHDDKWIGGPGITGWNMAPGNIGWFDDGDRIFFQSEESGFSHLYTYQLSSKETKALTMGTFEIHGAQLSKDNKFFFINSNKSDAGNRSYYRLELSSKKWSPILKTIGNYEVELSTDEKTLVYRYSNSTKPWEIYTSSVSGQKELQITHSQSEAFQNRTWITPKIVEFKAADGTIIRARKYASEKGNGAAVIFVHGAGYLQNAHNWWSGYYREYMFHNLLVEQGYTVLDIDYRASKGYGRDFRTDIYQHMGGKDLSDHLDGKKYLVESCGIDEDKVGIYGGSYGGFITLMALLTEPGEFACGAAIRSVTDWAHYNHEYTSNILNTPALDSNAYKKSGPIHFAKNLKDPLLMLHGLQDDNVQYQDIIRLSQRFIEAGVKDWELATYPIEPHGFKETSSWVDEYGRILKLFNTHLLKK